MDEVDDLFVVDLLVVAGRSGESLRAREAQSARRSARAASSNSTHSGLGYLSARTPATIASRSVSVMASWAACSSAVASRTPGSSSRRRVLLPDRIAGTGAVLHNVSGVEIDSEGPTCQEPRVCGRPRRSREILGGFVAGQPICELDNRSTSHLRARSQNGERSSTVARSRTRAGVRDVVAGGCRRIRRSSGRRARFGPQLEPDLADFMRALRAEWRLEASVPD